MACGVVLAGLVAAGCSDDDESTGSTDGAVTADTDGVVTTDVATTAGGTDTTVGVTDTTVATDPWADNEATGTPVTLGLIWDGATEAADLTALRDTYRAVVQYANEHLGGLAGHPIELLECSTDILPAKAAECANEMIQAEVPAVLSPGSGVQDAWQVPIAEAGIPVIAYQALTEAGANNPGIYAISNIVFASFGGPPVLAKQAGANRAAIFVIDVPTAVQALETIAPAFWEQAGIDFSVVKIPPDQADVAPSVQAELTENDPGFVSVIGTTATCMRVGRALQDAGYDGPISFNLGCVDADVAAQVDVEGTFALGSNSNLASSPEVQFLQEILDTYAPGTDLNASKTAYQGAMGFFRAMATLQGEITPESIKATLAAMPPTPLPLVDGATFQCNGTAVPTSKNICSSSAIAGIYDESGTIVEEIALSAADL